MISIGFMDPKDQDNGTAEESYTGAEIASFEEQIAEQLEELDDLPDEVLDNMIDGYDGIIVREYYADDYHLDEESRIRNNRFYREFSKLMRCKRKYRKLVEWVECARLAMRCLDMVAENNRTYDPDVFKKKVYKKEIVVYGWFYPIYNGRDKKQISPYYMDELVFSDEDPRVLLAPCEAETDYLSSQDKLAYGKTLYPTGAMSNLLSMSPRLCEEMTLSNDSFEQAADGSSIVRVSSDKETKEFFKSHPEVLLGIKKSQGSVTSASQLDRLVSDAHLSDIEKLEEFDKKHGFKKKDAVPFFTGSLSNKKDVDQYLADLSDYIEFETVADDVNNDKGYSPYDLQMMAIKELADSSGIITKELFGARAAEKQQKAKDKELRRKTERLKKRIIAMENRMQKGQDSGVVRSIESAKKSGKKSKKKGKKKTSEEDD